jgi:hypothetical protein
VRIIAAAATCLSPVQGADLAPTSPAAWRQLRTTLHERRHARVLGRRFRQSPDTYLHALEERLRTALPP